MAEAGTASMNQANGKSASQREGGERAAPERAAPERAAPEQEPNERFSFFLVRDFPMMCFAAAVEPLRSANRMSGRLLYAWDTVSRDGAPVTSSSGIEVGADHAIADVERLENLIVIGGIGVEAYDDRQVFAWLRKLSRQGCRLGAVSTGSYLLAHAGLLDGYRCTIHWENLVGFQEAFPKLDVTPELFEIDRKRMTCSGGIASVDLMLSLIGLEHGRELATAVAEQFIHERIRDQHDSQRMALRNRLGISHPKLLKVISLMEENLEDPLSRGQLARQAQLSTRQLERLFRKYLARTPTRYYLELRLHKARRLLRQTALSVLDVALACGFVSASHFSKCYREFFHKTPREERLLSS